MAAGRHRGNHDRGFRSWVSDVVSTKIEPCKDGIHDQGRGIRRNHLDSRDRNRFRNMDLKEGETVNGLHHTSSATSNSNLVQKKRHNVLGDLVDREPGELSSGSSGSEDQDAPQSEMVKSRKRKFSPIVWDKDGSKNATVVTTSEAVNYTGTPPPPPPLPKGFMPSNSTDAVIISKNSSPLETKSLTAVGHEDDGLGSTEHRTMELEEEYVPTRNISASRWADGDASEDDETRPTKRNKKTPVTLHRMASTSDLGEAVLKECAASEAKGQYDDNEDGKDCIDEKGSENNPAYLSDSDNEERSIVNKTPECVQPPRRSINMLLGCRSVDEFERLNKIDEGTYGVVYRAKDKKTGEVVALKKVKMEKEREGFPLTSLREINILLSFHHPSIVDVKEVVVGRSLDSIFMVMEYMDHDLKGLIESLKHPFSQSEVKCLMLQLLDGVKYLHDNWVLHRDLKTSNLLFNNCGQLKICDLGLSRQYGSPMKPYTRLVVTLWYRSPELLLGTREYSTAIDMWSLGCIMAELLAKEPLFNGKTEFDQLNKIFKILGTPNEKIWPGFSKLPGVKVNLAKHPYNRLREKFPPTSFSGRPTLSEKGFDLLNKLLTYDPEMRITADEALNHEWFKEVPLPKSKDFMPTFPAQHSQDRRLRRIFKSPDPLEEQRQRELQHGGIAMGSLFN